MAVQKPATALQLLAINALAITFLGATQDIAGDAYRTDVLEPQELEVGASIWVFGYRAALLVTGYLAIFLATYLPWPVVYLAMAGFMAIGIITSLWAPEPVFSDRAPLSLLDAVYRPFQEFFQRMGGKAGSLIFLFILLYKLGDALVGNMAFPFLLELGFSKAELASQGALSFWATSVGILAGGAILVSIGVNRGLWVFGFLQGLSNLGYFFLAAVGKNSMLLLLAINLENFCAGLVAAATVAFIMSLCNHRFSATQFALLSSLMAVSRDVLSAPAGEIAKITGWPNFFLLSLVATLPGLFLLPYVAPWNAPPIALATAEAEQKDP
jgi:PAT family beta-lactamase induction signal transducer AmpG